MVLELKVVPDVIPAGETAKIALRVTNSSSMEIFNISIHFSWPANVRSTQASSFHAARLAANTTAEQLYRVRVLGPGNIKIGPVQVEFKDGERRLIRYETIIQLTASNRPTAPAEMPATVSAERPCLEVGHLDPACATSDFKVFQIPIRNKGSVMARDLRLYLCGLIDPQPQIARRNRLAPGDVWHAKFNFCARTGGQILLHADLHLADRFGREFLAASREYVVVAEVKDKIPTIQLHGDYIHTEHRGVVINDSVVQRTNIGANEEQSS